MAFFQSKSTQTIPFPSAKPLQGGKDEILDVTKHTWAIFAGTTVPLVAVPTIHVDRNQAFREFIFMMFYYQHRRIDGSKFPHNKLCQKVLKYFYEHEPIVASPSSYSGVNIKMSIPKHAAGTGTVNNIFTIDAQYGFAEIASTNHLPALRRGEDYATILSEIKADMITGETSLGFFQEAATVFAYFYLTRQLIILNGHRWTFDAQLLNVGSYGYNVTTRVVSRLRSNDVYGSPARERTTEIMSKVNFNSITLPYFYNSLISFLKKPETGFNIPDTPLSPVAPFTISQDEVFLAYFVKMLDPYRCMGVYTPFSGMSTEARFTPPNPNATTLNPSPKNAIVISPDPAASSVDTRRPDNNFLTDLFVTMRSGNGGYNSLAGNPSPTVVARPFYSRPGALGPFLMVTATTPMSLSRFESQVHADMRGIYKEMSTIVQNTIEAESVCMMNIFYEGLMQNPQNTILGTGVGEVTASILGIKNFGLPFFSYDMIGTNLTLSKLKSGTGEIDLTKKQVLHFGGFGLDLQSGSSDFKVDAGNLGIFTFKLVPETGTSAGEFLTKDISIGVNPLSSPDFYNVKVINTTPSGTVMTSWRYYKKMPISNTNPVMLTDVFVAEYFEEKRDLVFQKFTPAQLDSLPIVPPPVSPNTVTTKINITYTVESKTAGGYTEELVTFVSIFEEESVQPSFISEEVQFENDTFQLFGLPAGKGTRELGRNKKSNGNLLTKQDDLASISLITDYLKEDYLRSIKPSPEPPRVTLNLPDLKGSYVGRLALQPAIPPLNPLPGVVADIRYATKFSPSSGSEDVPIDKGEKLYNMLRYSRAEIDIVPTIVSIHPTKLSLDLSIRIKSHVSPAKSVLENQYSGDDLVLLNQKRPGSPKNSNQVLAMLRSFGLLEAIVEKMIATVTTVPSPYTGSEQVYIVNRLREWLPAVSNPTEAENIVCVDETLPNGVSYAGNINLKEYYQLKRTY